MTDDPNLHWDGERWLQWNGDQWLHWDGEKWLQWDGVKWVPYGETSQPLPRQVVRSAQPPAPKLSAQPAVRQKAERTPFEVWGSGKWPNQETVGESQYAAQIRKVLRKHSGSDEVSVPAHIVTEPANRYDPNACAVHIEGGIVGYLPREDAARYAPVLRELESDGYVALTSARVWGSQGYGDDFYGSVSVCLGDPCALRPVNSPPATPYAELPVGRGIQVQGEEECMDVLAPFLAQASPISCYATLTRTEEGKKKPFLTVEIDGQRAGRLSPQMSTAILPLVDALSARGVLTVARASVEGNTLIAEMKVFAAKAAELSGEEVSALLAAQH